MNKPVLPRSLKLVAVGDAVGVVLPPDLVERLALSVGDRLRVSDTPDGFAATRDDADVDVQMSIAREVMRKRRRALAELAR